MEGENPCFLACLGTVTLNIFTRLLRLKKPPRIFFYVVKYFSDIFFFVDNENIHDVVQYFSVDKEYIQNDLVADVISNEVNDNANS